MSVKRVSIVGCVGVPARYGGFETLAANLASAYEYNHRLQLVIYCSSASYEERSTTYCGATLRYIPLRATGIQSLAYDAWSIVSAVTSGCETVVMLGVSGAWIVPLIRPFTTARFICNVDGVEWKRDKWGWLASMVLRWLERTAVRACDYLVADNDEIKKYLRNRYQADATTIAYGGDHALTGIDSPSVEPPVDEPYALSICRIEPENNIHMILESWKALDMRLVIVGNWESSKYGRDLRSEFKNKRHILLLDPQYRPGDLYSLRYNCDVYLHGHSAGGTNPSLVEVMHFGKPILAFDCGFNRATTENQALYFSDDAELTRLVSSVSGENLTETGRCMSEIAKRRYTWKIVAAEYLELFV